MSQTDARAAVRSPALPVRAVLAAGLALGLAGDLLLRGPGEPALNLFLLAAGLGGAIVALGARARLALGREMLVTLAVGIAFAATLALRGSELLRLLAFFAAAVAFALPALHAGAAWLRRSGVGDQIEALVWAGVNAIGGALRLAGVPLGGDGYPPAPQDRPGAEADRTRRNPARSVVLGLLLALPFLLAFGALFMSADRMFARLVTDLVDFDFQDILSHVVVTGILSWLACGYLSGFLTGTRLIEVRVGSDARPRIGLVEVGTALGLVDLLFLLFVTVQFRYLFGGSDLVEVTPGLTYAEYVRQGFGHLALACALVLPSLLAADWLLAPGHPGGARVFRALGGLLVLLLLVIIASALQRVRIYQTAYGLTEPRFYGAAFVGWLALLTIWFAATVLRGQRERFAFPALVSAFAFIAILIVVSPDRWIARTNLARAGTAPIAADSSTVDAHYLASLSADAVPTLVAALPGLAPESRCVLARSLLRRWGPDPKQASDWRHWNWAVARARATVSAESEGLHAMVAAVDPRACPARVR
jgi:hypothetical protein